MSAFVCHRDSLRCSLAIRDPEEPPSRDLSRAESFRLLIAPILQLSRVIVSFNILRFIRLYAHVPLTHF